MFGKDTETHLTKCISFISDYRIVVSNVDNGTYNPQNIVEKIIELIEKKQITESVGAGIKERIILQYLVWDEEKKIDQTKKAYVKAYDYTIEKYYEELEKKYKTIQGQGRFSQVVYDSKRFNDYISEVHASYGTIYEYAKNSKYYKGFNDAMLQIRKLTMQNREKSDFAKYAEGYKEAIVIIKNGKANKNNIKEKINEVIEDKKNGIRNERFCEGKLKRLEFQEQIWEEEEK